MSIKKLETGELVWEKDGMKITLVRYSDPDRLNAARNAAYYLGKTDVENVRRPLGIIEKGHVAEVFRGEHAEFVFEGVSKEVYDHLITYTTRTMRVAGGNRALRSDGYLMPTDRMRDEKLVKEHIEKSMESYHELIDAKETRQVARSAMPVAAKMNRFVFQFNFLTLGQSLFKQRIWERGAQGNTASVVQGMYELVNAVDSELWDTFYEWNGQPATNWTESRRKLQRRGVTVNDFLEKIDDYTSKKNLTDDLKEKSLVEVISTIYGNQKSMWD